MCVCVVTYKHTTNDQKCQDKAAKEKKEKIFPDAIL
jgi:hypothetical protein